MDILLTQSIARHIPRSVVITRKGKAIAAIVPVEDAELLRDLEDRIDLADAEIALAETREFGTIPWETVKAELGSS